MGTAEDARQAKALENISHHMKEVVRVFTALNENFVAFVKKMDEWNEVLLDAPDMQDTSKENKP